MAVDINIRRQFGWQGVNINGIHQPSCLIKKDIDADPENMCYPNMIPIFDFNITVYRYCYTEEIPKFWVNTIIMVAPEGHFEGFSANVFFNILRPLLLLDSEIIDTAKEQNSRGRRNYYVDDCIDYFEYGESADPTTRELAYLCGWSRDCGETMEQVIENQIG